MPKREYHFWVYILSSRSRNLYIGITNDLIRRITQHRGRTPGTHTGHYVIHRLVYFEYFRYVNSAIAREKELKHWTRAQKIELIERVNPAWEGFVPDLSGADCVRGAGEERVLWWWGGGSRFPAGMTTRKANANAKTEADSLRE